MVLRVLRDKVTKEMRVMYDLPENPDPRIHYDGEVDAPGDNEWVEFPDRAHFDVLAEARAKAAIHAGGLLGRIYIHDDRIEADKPPPRKTVAQRVREIRQQKGQNPNAPVTLDELDQADRDING